MTLKLSVHGETWPAIGPFRITGKTFVAFESIVVEIDLEEQRAVIDPPPGLIDDRAEIVSSKEDSSEDAGA